jgi:hypothetical protein
MEPLTRLRARLAEWRTVKPRKLSVASIAVDEALQSRNGDAVPLVRRRITRQQAQAHVQLIATRAADRQRQLEPLLVAELPNGSLLLVDGFHRLKGCRKAGLTEINARVLAMSRAAAVTMSKLVNTGSEHLAMDKNQAKEAAWQFYCIATRGGSAPSTEWPSIRTIVADFGCAKCSVEAMHKALARGVNPKDFSNDDRDAATGYPTWKAVCFAARPEPADESPQAIKGRREARITRMAEKMAATVEEFRQLDASDQLLVLRVLRADARGGDELVSIVAEAEEAEPSDF